MMMMKIEQVRQAFSGCLTVRQQSEAGEAAIFKSLHRKAL